MACQITVEQGTLQGRQCNTFYGKKYYSFEGIPYAEPPVGKLRFSEPLPPKPWNGILDATKPGPKCIQANPYSAKNVDGSEDCLYLNIYTPVLPQEKIQKLPVLFFIHGGRLIFGHGSYYTPDFIIKHDVVLVTLNYRMHILGFLCLNLPECTGNMGLKDVLMALKWVNTNIGGFNGDCGNITLMGESAGGAMATSFMTTKVADGLFSKMIAQSGNCISDLYMDWQDPIEKAQLIATLMGNEIKDPKEIYNFFLNAPIEDLLMAFTTAELGRPQTEVSAYFLPVVEKKFPGKEQFFSQHPSEVIKSGKFTKVPLITCFNSFEVALFFNEDGKVKFYNELDFLIPKYAKIDKKNHAVVAKKILDFYLNGKPLSDDSKIEYLTMVSDAYFQRDLMLLPEYISKTSKSNVYVLKFDYFGGMNTRVMKTLDVKGTSHGDLIQYQFYRKNKWEESTEKDKEVVEFLSEAYANFMKNGEPSWRNQKTKWLPYSAENRQVLHVADEITMKKDLDNERLMFWSRIIGEYSKL